MRTEHSSQSGNMSLLRPVYRPQDGSQEEEEEEMDSLDTVPEPITVDMVQAVPGAQDVPYIVYSDETNPWDVVQGEVSSNNLYKRSGPVKA